MKTTKSNKTDRYLVLQRADAGANDNIASPTHLIGDRGNWLDPTRSQRKSPAHLDLGTPSAMEFARHNRKSMPPVVAPRNPNEKLMASIWRDILNLPEISVYDNFFDHGRDSYLAIEIVDQVRKVFSVKLSLKALFEDPTVAGMTAAVLRYKKLRTRAETEPVKAPEIWRRTDPTQRILSKSK